MFFQISNVMAISPLLVPTGVDIAINGWWVVVIFLVLVVVISLLVLSNRQVPSITPIVSHGHAHDQGAHAADLERAEMAEIPLLDDLTKIEGIGPKIAKILSDEGINTFLDLADSDVDSLKRILDEARLSFADPSTWPKQARMANLQEWQSLEAYKAELKAGRSDS